jgi:HTH-type transcriptional regulator/antitoxin HigA
VDEMGVIAIDPVEYGQLLASARPKIIETEAEFRQARKLLEDLTFADRELSPAEFALRELLKKLVTDYDDRMHPLPKVEARKLVRRLLEQRELKQKDLVPVLGASSTVSDILSGKRSISKAQAKKLGEFFRVSAEYFI